MEDHSIFTDKSVMPAHTDLESGIGQCYACWTRLADTTLRLYPEGIGEWNYPGPKFGWSYRIRDKKRAIIYLLPREGYFKVAFVYGEKAFDEVMKSSVNQMIKDELSSAKPYREGRGIRLDVRDDSILSDLEILIRIKLQF